MVLGLGGFFSGSSTQTSTSSAEAAPLSERGRSYEDLFAEFMAGGAEELGYEITYEDKEVYQDQEKASGLESKISNLTTRLESVEEELAEMGVPAPNADRYTVETYNSKLNEKRRLESDLQNAETDLAELPKDTYKDFEVTKLEDIRVRDAIDRYGEDAPEVDQIRSEVQAEKVFAAEGMADIKYNFINNLKKYTSGDMSFTEEQEAQIEQYIGPVRNVLNKTADNLITMVGEDRAEIEVEFDKIAKAIDQTQYDTESALKAAEIQMEKSGKNLFEVIEDVNSSSESRAKFEFDLLSQDIDQKVNDTYALLGLPPSSQSAEMEKARQKQNALKSVLMQLDEQEMKLKLGVQSSVEEGKIDISLQRAGLAERSGSKREALAKDRTNMVAGFLSEERDIEKARSAELTNLEKEKSTQLFNAAFGGLPSMINTGMAGMGFNQGQAIQSASAQANMGTTASSPMNFEQQKSVYEGTKTGSVTQSSSPSFFDAFTDVAGVALGGYGAGMDFGWWGNGKDEG